MSVKGKGFFKGELFSFDLPQGWNLLAMAEPKDYYTLSGSDHYSNVAHIGPWAVYDKEVVDETVTVLDDWMTRILQESPSS